MQLTYKLNIHRLNQLKDSLRQHLFFQAVVLAKISTKAKKKIDKLFRLSSFCLETLFDFHADPIFLYIF